MNQEQKHDTLTEAESRFFEIYGLRVLKALRQINRAMDIHSRKINNDYHVTVPQMICLCALANTEPMTLSQLAERVTLSASTTNGVVDRLEAKGLIRRNLAAGDRRKKMLNITDEGRALTTEAPLLLQDRLTKALSALPELEQAAIALSLERITDLIDVNRIENPTGKTACIGAK